MNCLENIIGITNRNCNCVDFTPVTVESGIYLDEAPFFNNNFIVNTGSCSGLKEAELAISTAIKDVQSDLFKGYKDTHSPNINLVNSNSGLKPITKYDAVNKVYKGLSFRPIRADNLVFKINKATFLYKTSDNLPISIYSKLNNSTPILIGTATLVNERYEIQVNASYNLNLGDVLYLYTDSDKVVSIGDNRCGCPSHINPLAVHMYINRFTEDVFKVADSCENYPYGVIINSNLQCDFNSIACNFINADLNNKKVLAPIVRLKALSNLTSRIISNESVDTELKIDKENLNGTYNWYTNNYKDELRKFINDNSLNGYCYTCRSKLYAQ